MTWLILKINLLISEHLLTLYVHENNNNIIHDLSVPFFMNLSPEKLNWIINKSQLEEFKERHSKATWIAFDTEFIGERRDQTLLCLIQIASDYGIYLIDTIQLEEIGIFLEMIASESILKITHAGENDYKVFYELYQIIPQNVIDIQVAAGFSGSKYPASLATLALDYAKEKLDKSQTIIDWAVRPLSQASIKYAVEDVLYLKQIYEKLKLICSETGKWDWIVIECSQLENANYYVHTPEEETMSIITKGQYSAIEKINILRVFRWRAENAGMSNKKRERLLSKKWVPTVARKFAQSREESLTIRMLPAWFIKNHYEELNQLLREAHTKEELEGYFSDKNRIKSNTTDNSAEEVIKSVFNHFCREKGIDPYLIVRPAFERKYFSDEEQQYEWMFSTWRKHVINLEWIEMMQNKKPLDISFGNDEIIIKRKH